MVVCNFFLQGRCRYGEKCWNEHPRGGGRGGGGQQQPRGEHGGFGNRVWVNPSQQKGGYIQPSYFSSHGRNDWGGGGGGGGGSGGGGGGRRDHVKSSEFSFSTQNRFASLDTSKSFVDRGGRGGTAAEEDDSKKLEMIQMDMDVWESSGQWGFSCYSIAKVSLSGFTDLSPEELRLEYYSKRASGDLQTYINGVNQLLSQRKNRIQELKSMNPSTRAALLAELNGAGPQGSAGGFGAPAEFGSSTPGFGGKGFGSPAPAQTGSFGIPEKRPEFGLISAAATPAGFGSPFGSPSQPPSGFGAPAGPSASNFSFAPPSDKPAGAPGFGSASALGLFPAGFGGMDGAGATATTAAGGSSAFPQTSGGFGAASAAAGAGAQSDSLFSSESQLTQEELEQFKAKRFTLGQIPLKPPPANLLVL
ncbi:nucleoporin-like protein 2 [Oryzias latipes]|uniref:Nucleoporin NUP42 n=1 Tax=Oryzias latipes TaxID=8090 RepID=A0A3B3H6E7_ORYLA|nr:nucleoporin-like protein 2 [Oryzias latipes]